MDRGKILDKVKPSIWHAYAFVTKTTAI